MPELAMFPLGSVLFPTLGLPLHVFEPRYRQLVDDCLAAEEPEFGVVLIERGSEVGGDDVRSSVGTVARIVQAEQYPDGRWGIVAVGVRRFRVERWLTDDPYPRAEVSDWPEPVPGGGADDATADSRYREVLGVLRRALALSAEVGDPAAPIDIVLSPDPVIGSYQVAAVGPFGPADQHALLSVPDAATRLDRLGVMLAEEVDVLEQRLALG